MCFDIKTPDVEKETCLELHADDGTMAEAMLPAKVDILQKKFFSGFASIVYSEKLKKYFWKSQQAWFPEIESQADTVFSFPGLKTPEYEIPYYKEKIKGEFPGFSTIALHYGSLIEPGDLVSYFGNFTLKEVHPSV